MDKMLITDQNGQFSLTLRMNVYICTLFIHLSIDDVK